MRGNVLPIGRPAAVIIVATFCAVRVETARAAFELTANASVGAEYNSNPLQLSALEAAPAGNGAKRDDVSKRASINMSAGYHGTGPLQFQLRGSLIDANFDHFNTLGRRDHDLTGILDWKPAQQSFDASLQAQHASLPIPIADVGGTKATQQTTTSARTTLHLRAATVWQFGVSPFWNETDTPLPTAKGFKSVEKGGNLALEYIGAGPVVPGVTAGEIRGRYSGITDATRYDQYFAQLTLRYKATGLSTFSFSGGQTWRTTNVIDITGTPTVLIPEKKESGFMGSANYSRKLTAKTSFTIGAYRAFLHYAAGLNPSIDTGFTSGVTWAATPLLTAALDTSFILSKIDDTTPNGVPLQREDLTRNYTFSVTYQAFRHVSVRTRVTRQTRNSTIQTSQFNNLVGGVDLIASLK